MHDGISREATKVKIYPHFSCKNYVVSHSLIKSNSIQILYAWDCNTQPSVCALIDCDIAAVDSVE